MSRGSVYQALQKLSGDWSAPEYAKTLTREVLTELLPSFEMMEPLVRARLLLAAASLPASAQDVMREQLQVCCSCIAILLMERVHGMHRASALWAPMQHGMQHAMFSAQRVKPASNAALS